MKLHADWKVPKESLGQQVTKVLPLGGLFLSFCDVVSDVRIVCRISIEIDIHRKSVVSSVSDDFKDDLKLKLQQLKARGCTPKTLSVFCVAAEQFSSTANQVTSLLSSYGIQTVLHVAPMGSNVHFDSQSGALSVMISASASDVKTSIEEESQNFRVLIVEDSLPVQKLLTNAYSSMRNVEIVGFARSAAEALKIFNEKRPNFVSLDLNLENSTGLDFLRDSEFSKRLIKSKVASVLVTDCNPKEGTIVLDAFELGASCYIPKPNVSSLASFQLELKSFFSELAFHWNRKVSDKKNHFDRQELYMRNFQLIAFGSSTGGTEVLIDVLSELPENSPPVLIVQHMPPQFTKMFAERIQLRTGIPTIEVFESQPARRGHIYLAGGGVHMRVVRPSKSGMGLMLEADVDGPAVNRFKPSVSVLFGSIADAGVAKQSLAFVLTGMGNDGAKEMTAIKKAGGVTVGQSSETCAVYGMPRAVDELGGLNVSLSPQKMRELLKNLLSSSQSLRASS